MTRKIERVVFCCRLGGRIDLGGGGSFGRWRLLWEGEAPAEPADVVGLCGCSPWREMMAAE
jgi:hypothetical protein